MRKIILLSSVLFLSHNLFATGKRPAPEANYEDPCVQACADQLVVDYFAKKQAVEDAFWQKPEVLAAVDEAEWNFAAQKACGIYEEVAELARAWEIADAE